MIVRMLHAAIANQSPRNVGDLVCVTHNDGIRLITARLAVPVHSRRKSRRPREATPLFAETAMLATCGERR